MVVTEEFIDAVVFLLLKLSCRIYRNGQYGSRSLPSEQPGVPLQPLHLQHPQNLVRSASYSSR